MARSHIARWQNPETTLRNKIKEANSKENILPIICPQSSYLLQHRKALGATGTQGPES